MRLETHEFRLLRNWRTFHNLWTLKENDKQVYSIVDMLGWLVGLEERVYRKAYFVLGYAEHYIRPNKYCAYTYVDNMWQAIKRTYRKANKNEKERLMIESAIKTDTHEVLHCVLYDFDIDNKTHHWAFERLGLNGL